MPSGEVSGELFGRLVMKRFAVIGLGRFGKKLAIALAMSGAEVIAMDKNRDEIELIRDQVSHAVRLDSTDEEALKAQGIDKVDVAIVGIGQGTGQGFESSVLTVVNLKQLGIKQIYARAEDIIAGEVFSKIGATEVIYPEIESAQRWAYKLIAPQIGEKIDFAPGYSLARVKAPASFDGKTVMDLQLRQKYNVNLVAIKRDEQSKAKKSEKGSIINVPMPSTIIYQDDILMVAGSDVDLAKLPQE
jgi:trk system potassium uptake protein TrkA